MKKKYIIIICVFILLCSIITIVHFTNNKIIFNKTLSGDKLTDGLYKYSLNDSNYAMNATIIGDYIYYMYIEDEKYELYRRNIYAKDNVKVGTVESSLKICYMDNKLIRCLSDDMSKEIFDMKINRIYYGYDETIIPYKDSYLKIIGNTIYYKDKEYRKLDDTFSDLIIFDSYVYKDNTYFFITDNYDKYYLYNTSDNKLEETEMRDVKKHSKGLYSYDKDKIYVMFFDNEETKEYNNVTNDELLSNSVLDNNVLYYFSDDYLKIYNLENETVKLLDYRLNIDAYDIVLNDNLLYIITSGDVYIIKLDEVVLEEMSLEQLNEKLENIIISKIEKLSNEYNVDFKIRKDSNLKFKLWKESTIGETDYDRINDSLDYTEEVLSLFGSEFFKEFIHDDYTGIRIYLVNEIKSKDFSKAGEAFRYYDKYAIIADTSDYKRTLCHELMHSLEDAVDAKWKTIFKKWNNYNPKGFKYNNNYKEFDSSYKYTPDYGEGEIYFVDNYSQTNELEDRARIFENMCMNTPSVINDNPKLLEKAKYLESEIKKNYPMLEKSIIFENIK